MRISLAASVAIALGCGGQPSKLDMSTSMLSDLAPPIDMAVAVDMAGACPQSLTSYCSQSQDIVCNQTLAQLRGNLCSDGGQRCNPAIDIMLCGILSVADCGQYTVISSAFPSDGWHYFFDRTTGALVAVLTYNDGSGQRPYCVGGPSGFSLPQCAGTRSICP